MRRITLFLTIVGVLTALALILAFAGPARASPDIGDLKDGFTIAAVVLSQIFGAGAVWGAIRADIRNLHDKVESAHEAAKEAHERIDALYERGSADRRR